MGIVMLGIFTFNHYGLQGALLQSLNHGIVTGGLFLMVGMIYDRRHTRQISEFGGLAKQIPKYSICFMIITLASIGLPGTNGFVGEFMILLGLFQESMFFATIATSGVIFAACYMLWMFQRVIFLELKNPENKKLLDLDLREKIILVPIIILIFWIGFYPSPVTRTFDATIEKLIVRVDPANFKPGGNKKEKHQEEHHAKIKHGQKIAEINKIELPNVKELD